MDHPIEQTQHQELTRTYARPGNFPISNKPKKNLSLKAENESKLIRKYIKDGYYFTGTFHWNQLVKKSF